MADAYYLGLDVAQAGDYTALAVLRRREAAYDLVYLQRARGLPYVGTPQSPGLVEKVRAFFAGNAHVRNGQMAVDRTGVGRAVVDAFRAANLPCVLWALTITGGQTSSRQGLDASVPKKDLVGAAQTLLGSGRLAFDPALPLAEVLRQEFKTFQVKISAAGNETFAAWRENAHDDLVFAVAMAAWLGEQFPPLTRGSIRSGGRAASPPAGTFGTGRQDARRPPKF